MPLKPQEDAYGHMVYDHFCGVPTAEVIERDDGWIGMSAGAPAYFAPFRRWPRQNREAMRYVRGRVLDIGCGPGRAAIHLQERGHDVLSIDLSPLAVKTARLCGVRRAQVRSVTQVNARLGRFDTLLMLGNNFGLMSSRARARWLLRRFAGVTPPSGRVVAEAVDPYLTDDPDHLRYHRTNRARGRMSGQIRMRVRYRRFRTPWFDYLLVSQKEMWGLVRGTAWTVERFIDGDGPAYVVVLEKRDVA